MQSKQNSQKAYDIVIAGGGVVGCAAAIALNTHTQYSVAVIEAFNSTNEVATNKETSTATNAETKTNTTLHPSFDARVVALARESYKHLLNFGVDMTKVPSCPIDEIHVSDRGHLGQTRLKEHSGMGNVLALADLGKQLLEQIKDTDIDYYCPYKIAQVERSTDACSIIIENSSQNNSNTTVNSKVNTTVDSKPSEAAIGLKAKLVIIAEGGSAPSMALFNLAQSTVSYEQTAFIANVITQQPHRNRAFERFTEHGPVALLPMTSPVKQAHSRHSSSQQMSLVWTCDERQAESINALDDDAFLHKLQQLFGDRLGRLQASSTRFSYPLKLVKAKQYSGHRVLCIGNAAQSLHPIAGQGFNLGVRDIDALVRVIKKGDDRSDKAEEEIVDPGAFVFTNEYKKQRQHDKSAVIAATDSLVRLFSNQYLPTVVGRNIGLVALNHAPKIKNRLASFAMGKRKRMR